MAFKDESILKKREMLKRRTHTTLEGGFYVRGKVIYFDRKEMFDIFTIYIPNIMRIMPDDIARIKYPSEFRPNKILTTLDLDVNIGFSILWDGIQTKDAEKLTIRMMSAIKRSNSDFQFYEMEKIGENEGYYFAFRSHAMDSDIYNMMLVEPVGDHLMLSSFNCLYQEMGDWKKVVLLMWKSIAALDKKEVGEHERK